MKNLRKNLPLLIMALPGVIMMIMFRYLPMGGIILAFKKYNIRKGIFGSEFIGLKNFEFLFKTRDAFIITRNTILYNLVFIALNLIVGVMIAIALNELLSKYRAKIYQTIFMAPYFLSWVVISFIAFALFSQDAGLFNKILIKLGMNPITWYSDTRYWPIILVLGQLWRSAGYGTVMYLSSIVAIPQDLYEAAVMDGATKWQQIKYITIPCLKNMMIILSIIAIGRMFYSDFGLFYQLPRNSGPLFNVTNVIDTYVYRTLKDTNNIGMSAAANFYQSILGFITIMVSNWIVNKIDKDSALF